MFMPYSKLFALSKCCLVLWTTSEMSQLVKLGEKGVNSGMVNFSQHLSKRAET